MSQYPKLEGRFPQVAGISFAFDPKKPPGSRIDPKFIKIGDEYLDMNQVRKKVLVEIFYAVINFLLHCSFFGITLYLLLNVTILVKKSVI